MTELHKSLISQKEFTATWRTPIEKRGDARDRASVIDQFQSGNVPVSLISLKAEGVLSEDADALTKFGESDIQALLAPLPKDKT